MILTEEERNAIEDGCEMMIGKPAFDAVEAAVLAKLAQGVSVEPVHHIMSDGVAIGYYSLEQLTTAIAAARVAENERCANWLDKRGASPVQPSQAQAALDAILWYYENCTGSDSSISAFRQMVDRVVKMKPNFCESCAMDIATCDCVTPRPATVTVQPSQGLQSVADALTIEQLNDKVERLMAVQPSQAGGVSKQDIYDIAHRKATRYVCTAAPSDVMYGFSEMHLLDFVAAINAKGVGNGV